MQKCCVFSVPLDLRAEHFLSFCLHFAKQNVQKQSFLEENLWKMYALQKYIFAPNAFVTFYFALHFPKKMFSNAKKKGKSKKESIFTSAILTFYQVKTKYYVFCEQNAEVCINIGF